MGGPLRTVVTQIKKKLYCYFSPFKNSNLINNKQAFFSVIIIKVVSTEFMNSLVFNKKCPEK